MHIVFKKNSSNTFWAQTMEIIRRAAFLNEKNYWKPSFYIFWICHSNSGTRTKQKLKQMQIEFLTVIVSKIAPGRSTLKLQLKVMIQAGGQKVEDNFREGKWCRRKINTHINTGESHQQNDNACYNTGRTKIHANLREREIKQHGSALLKH